MSRERRLVALRHDLIRVARANGRPEGVAPTSAEYTADSRRQFSLYRVGKATGALRSNGAIDWTAAMRRVGLTPANEARPDPEAIIADLHRVAAERGHPGVLPNPAAYEKLGRWSKWYVTKHLAGGLNDWREVAKRAGMRTHRRSFRVGDTREAVIERVRRYADARGYKPGEYGPSVTELTREGVVSDSVAIRLFGNGSELVKAAGYKPLPFGGLPPEIRRARLTKRAA